MEDSEDYMETAPGTICHTEPPRVFRHALQSTRTCNTFAWEHIRTGPSSLNWEEEQGIPSVSSELYCMEMNGSAAVFCTDFYYCMYFGPV